MSCRSQPRGTCVRKTGMTRGAACTGATTHRPRSASSPPRARLRPRAPRSSRVRSGRRGAGSQSFPLEAQINLAAVARLLPTTVVGSYPQPDWLVDRQMLGSRLPPRVRAREIWRVAPEFLDQAQDDATVVAIRDMERAGIDIVTDGEIRRESYSNRFATALESMDLANPGTALARTGHPNPVPRVVGPIRRARPVEKRDVQFLRANTDRAIKATLPGPFTMSQQAQDDYYRDDEAFAMALAEAVNEEVRDLFAAGADVVQLDEPYLQARAENAQRFAIQAINRALHGSTGTA